MGRSAMKLKAILYLHALRTWRFKYSFINSTINIGLWVAIFILGALIFVPKEEIPATAPYMFWGVVLWTVMSSSVWSVGGWTWFITSLGMYEEHTLHGTSLAALLSGRSLTVATDTALITPVMYFLVQGVAGGDVRLISNPAFIAYGVIAMFIMSLAYGLTLSAVSMRIGVPGTLLDISNFLFLVIGGMTIPVSKLPGGMKYVALSIPFSYPSEVVRYGATGLPTYLPLWEEAALTGVLATTMITFAALLFRHVEMNYLRKQGPRAIGRM